MASRRGHRRSGLWATPLDHDLYASSSSPYYSSPAPSSPFDPYACGYAAHFDRYGPGTPSSSSSSSSSSSNNNIDNYYLTTPRVYSNGDISQAEARMRAQQLAAPSPEDGELPDILIFKYQNESWSFEFPAFSIDDDRLCVSDIRRLAGQTLNIADISRIKLMYKGRLMTDDAASAKSQGLKQFSEVVAIVMPGYTEGVYAVPPYPSPPPAPYDPLPNICREPRTYATSHPSPSVSSTVSSSTYTSYSASTAASTAGSVSPTVPTSIPAAAKPKPKPKANKAYSVPNRPPTPCPPFLASHSTSDKLTIFETYVNDKLIPLCTRFIMHPPADVRVQNKEQRRLSEAMERVLARADEITVGSSRPLRDRRKAVVQMVQRFQTRIDAMIVPE
ncbi:hypothetical protein TEQG_01513 [Trichophyton equinum CBS 127.97]|uniref:BAG domain-containing protein n=1 Tax=Trichophyton equinum (strain ATCC MYA-4606 / CBS 127.97) TaxID=559882 RepID=F2PKQ9_TRIEC|nr:hypothetical protein TEQG_01513 [Trichophyton equinum CBS 127.97]